MLSLSGAGVSLGEADRQPLYRPASHRRPSPSLSPSPRRRSTAGDPHTQWGPHRWGPSEPTGLLFRREVVHEEDEDFSGAHWRGGGGGDRHPRHPHRRRSSSAGTQTPTKGLSELQSLVMAHADVPPVTHSPEVPAAAAAAATAPRARRSLATPTPTPTTKRKGRPSQQKCVLSPHSSWFLCTCHNPAGWQYGWGNVVFP